MRRWFVGTVIAVSLVHSLHAQRVERPLQPLDYLSVRTIAGGHFVGRFAAWSGDSMSLTPLRLESAAQRIARSDIANIERRDFTLIVKSQSKGRRVGTAVALTFTALCLATISERAVCPFGAGFYYLVSSTLTQFVVRVRGGGAWRTVPPDAWAPKP